MPSIDDRTLERAFPGTSRMALLMTMWRSFSLRSKATLLDNFILQLKMSRMRSLKRVASAKCGISTSESRQAFIADQYPHMRRHPQRTAANVRWSDPIDNTTSSGLGFCSKAAVQTGRSQYLTASKYVRGVASWIICKCNSSILSYHGPRSLGLSSLTNWRSTSLPCIRCANVIVNVGKARRISMDSAEERVSSCHALGFIFPPHRD